MKKVQAWRIIVFSILSMWSGVALVVFLLWKISLALALSTLGLMAGLIMYWQFHQLPLEVRLLFIGGLKKGLVIGVYATIAYDLSRWILVSATGMEFWPFKTFLLFGQSILGVSATPTSAWIVGTLYHILNGLTFSVGYCLLLGGSYWALGVAWALLLELIMFSLYPGWLDLRGMMGEFTTVSLTGHFAYGATLGLLSQRWMRPLNIAWRRKR